MAPSWPPKSIKNLCKNQSFFACLLESIYGWILLDFGYIPKWDQKSMLAFKAENQLNASRLAFNWLSGVEVGSQNRPKIDQKTQSKMDGILASIFLRFWSVWGAKLGGKPEPRSTQKGIEKRCKKEEQRDCQKSRNKNLQPPTI